MSDDKDSALVVAIVRELKLANEFLRGISEDDFEQDVMRQHAVAMAVAQTGEYVKKLSPEFRARTPEVSWKAMAGIRDWIVHNYEGLDFEELYESVVTDAPVVLEYLAPLVQALQQDQLPDAGAGIEDFLSGSDTL